MNFLVFSDDWGVHPSSCQHIFRQLCGAHRTVWVNTVGLRPPRLSLEDFRKACKKVTTMLRVRKARPATDTSTDPILCAPYMFPFERPRWLGTWNKRSVLRSVARVMDRNALSHACAVTTVPNVHRVVEGLGAEKVIYYCVDDFSEWPGLDKSIILGMEKQLLRSVKAVICTSEALYDRFRKEFPTTLLTHGVDLELFARPMVGVHPALESIPEPRVGYYGLFDRRTDHELLRGVAQALPEISFVITGPTEGDCGAVRSLRNVHFTGPVPYAELPLMVNGWRACLLPYCLNELTMKINPLKLKEYLATGRPVVSTPLPEAVKLLPHLRIASSVDEWVLSVREAVNGSWLQDKPRVMEYLRPHSWTHKAEEFLGMCEAA